MLGKYIANTIMLSWKMDRAYCEKMERERGFNRDFDDYDKVWDRHPFAIESDDATISGEYIINPANTGLKKVALICHGLSSVRYADLKYATSFYDLGYNLVLFDERYFGKSTGPYCTMGYKESDDVKRIIRYIHEIFGKDCFLALHGESMGAATSLNILDTEKPDLVVADCPFADADLLLKDLAFKHALFLGPLARKKAVRIGLKRYNYDYRVVKPISSVKSSSVPILFMHGSNDKLIDCKHSKMMYEVCKNPMSEIHLFSGADHAQSIVKDTVNYEKIMKAFIEKVEVESGLLG